MSLYGHTVHDACLKLMCWSLSLFLFFLSFFLGGGVFFFLLFFTVVPWTCTRNWPRRLWKDASLTKRYNRLLFLAPRLSPFSPLPLLCWPQFKPVKLALHWEAGNTLVFCCCFFAFFSMCVGGGGMWRGERDDDNILLCEREVSEGKLGRGGGGGGDDSRGWRGKTEKGWTRGEWDEGWWWWRGDQECIWLVGTWNVLQMA